MWWVLYDVWCVQSYALCVMCVLWVICDVWCVMCLMCEVPFPQVSYRWPGPSVPVHKTGGRGGVHMPTAWQPTGSKYIMFPGIKLYFLCFIILALKIYSTCVISKHIKRKNYGNFVVLLGWTHTGKFHCKLDHFYQKAWNFFLLDSRNCRAALVLVRNFTFICVWVFSLKKIEKFLLAWENTKTI